MGPSCNWEKGMMFAAPAETKVVLSVSEEKKWRDRATLQEFAKENQYPRLIECKKETVRTSRSLGWARTSDLPVNSRALCQLSYEGI